MRVSFEDRIRSSLWHSRMNFRYLFHKDQNPVSVNYDITHRCNLRCQHCYYYHSGGGAHPELSTEEWTEVFRTHAAQGAKAAYLTGGEPTLRMDVVSAADEIFDTMILASNGIKRVPDDIRRRIWVSLDGPEEVHDAIRGTKCFQKVAANIAGDQRVIVSHTISATNWQYLEETVELCRALGVAGMLFLLYTSNSGIGDPLLLDDAALEETCGTLFRLWRKYKDFMMITPKMIEAYKTKAFAESCVFLGSGIACYYPDMTKKRCVMGDNALCSTCGCIVPAVAYCAKRLDHNISRLAAQMYLPEYGKAFRTRETDLGTREPTGTPQPTSPLSETTEHTIR